GDEWQRSYTRNDENGEKDNIAARILLDWDPTDNLSLKLNLNGWRNRDDTQAPSAIAIRPQNPIGSVGFGGEVTGNESIFKHPLGPRDNRKADWVSGLPHQDSTFWQASVRADYEFDNGLTLTSITSYSDYDHENATDGTGVSLINLDIVSDTGDIESFTQEIRLANDPSERLRWLVGANYEKSKVFQHTDLRFDDNTSHMVNGFNYNAYWSDQEMKNLAGFFNLEFDISDEVTLKAGVRQTNAKRDSVAYTGDMGRAPVTNAIWSLTEFFNAVYGAVYGGAVPTLNSGDSIVLDPATLTTIEPRSKLDEDSTSWSVGVDYKITPRMLLYANVMKGYKAGSSPHVSGAINTAFEPVRHESVVTVETGFKLTTENSRHTVNGAIFHNSYENKQIRSKFVDPVFAELDRLVNVPKSTIQGAELEVNSRLLEGLTVSAAVTYMDTEVRKYEGVIGSRVLPNGLLEGVTTSFRGVSLPHAPRWSYSVRADYEHSLENGLVGFVGVGVDGQSESIGVLTALSEEKDLFGIDSYALVSANIGVRTEDGRWQAMLWGKNITNKTYWTQAMTAYDTAVRYYGRPAEYGISVAYRF
ncbi:MAG: TonB-dependent receptor, partial [Anaerovoracaceae bacterium]